MRAALARDREHVVARGRRDHARPERRGERDGRAADARPGAPHEHPFAGLQARAGHQHAPGGGEHERVGRGLGEAQRLGLRVEVAHGHDAVVGMGARQVLAEHARSARTATAGRAGRPRRRRRRCPGLMTTSRARRRALGAGAERLDDARAVGAERVRLGARRLAQADPDVDAVERAGAHAHEGLARPRLGDRHVAIHEHDLGAALLMDPHGAHRTDRIRLLPMQDELAADGLLLGVARAEPYAETERLIAERRARGLFGDLRFTLTNTPRSCHPERLVRGARSVIAAAMPLWRPGRRRGPTGPVGRMPRYAWSDPYAPLRERLHGRGRPPARARRALRGLRRLQPPRRPRRRRARRASRSRRRTRWRSCPARARSSRSARSSPTPSSSRRDELVPPGCGSCTLCLDACPTGRADRARRARRDALPLDDDAGARARSRGRTPTRSRTASTAATSARTCARGTPARRGRRADLPEDPGAWVSLADWLELPGRGAAGAPRAPLRARARPALPAPQRAGRARQRAGRSSASWRGPTRTSPIRCCATPRGARSQR